jgi:hypothetical protein
MDAVHRDNLGSPPRAVSLLTAALQPPASTSATTLRRPSTLAPAVTSLLPAWQRDNLGEPPRWRRRLQLDQPPVPEASAPSTSHVARSPSLVEVSDEDDLPPARLTSNFSVIGVAPRLTLLERCSQTQSAERRRLHDVASSCVAAAHAPTTVTRYQDALQVHIGGAERRLGASLLPMDSPAKLMAAFAGLDGVRWSSIRIVKSAVRAWHVAHNVSSVFDAAWCDACVLFWKGLKRRADHTSLAKRALEFSEVLDFQAHRILLGQAAGLRDAAIAAICFYGIRRISETLALPVEGVTFEADAVKIFITKQKNDPGRGVTCWVPRLPRLGPLCPHKILDDWMHLRAAAVGNSSGPLFVVTGRSSCKPVSYDLFRKVVNGYFVETDVGSHSFRKGGARWYTHARGVNPDLVQAQGGWLSAATMRAVYTQHSSAEHRAAFVSGADSVPLP